MSPSTTQSVARNRRPRQGLLWLWLSLLAVVVIAGWTLWVYSQIRATAHIDNARPADAIAVFGAAEYAGRPSPVLHARLDKAVSLWQHQIAPLVITLGGGSSRDSGNTEGAVGRDYLLARGIPYADIIAETSSFDTEQQVAHLAAIARARHLRSIVVVSDGQHLFRIALLCRRAGLTVYTSPRARLGHIDDIDAAERILHEVLSYTALRFGLHASWLHRWLEGHNN